MSQATPPTSSDSGAGGLDLEKYRVHSATEILRVLRDLIKSHELITAYFNGGRDFILSAVLDVDMEHKRLVLDYGPDERLNQRLLEATRVVFATRHHQVRVQFNAETVIPAQYHGGKAFVIALPDSIIRLQRREYYRLSTPVGQRLNLSLPGHGGERIHAHIIDISLGGLGIIEPPEGAVLHWEPGTIIKGCHIELPEEGGIEVDIEIRNRYEAGQHNGAVTHRLGCRLLQLDSRRSAVIQRYIHRLELERLRVRHD